jgi:hypothetical protein
VRARRDPVLLRRAGQDAQDVHVVGEHRGIRVLAQRHRHLLGGRAHVETDRTAVRDALRRQPADQPLGIGGDAAVLLVGEIGTALAAARPAMAALDEPAAARRIEVAAHGLRGGGELGRQQLHPDSAPSAQDPQGGGLPLGQIDQAMRSFAPALRAMLANSRRHSNQAKSRRCRSEASRCLGRHPPRQGTRED